MPTKPTSEAEAYIEVITDLLDRNNLPTEDLDKIHRQLDGLARDVHLAKVACSNARGQLTASKAQLEALNLDLAKAGAKLEEKNAELAVKDAEILRLRKSLNRFYTVSL